MRHDILSRPKETENLDYIFRQHLPCRGSGGAFVFVGLNCEARMERPNSGTMVFWERDASFPRRQLRWTAVLCTLYESAVCLF